MTEEMENSYSPFWPLAILTLTYLIFTGWQVSTVISAMHANTEFSKQLADDITQAKTSEGNMDNFYHDLLELAKTDPDAKAIVDHNQIHQNPTSK